MSALRRQLYRGAMVLLRVHRYVFRPRVRGVRCVLVHDGAILLVRHTYGDRRWGLPGGLMRRRERAHETAKREMFEELALEDLEWSDLGRVDYRGVDHAHHQVRCFTCSVVSRDVTPNDAEIAEIAWFAWEELPRDSLDGTRTIAELARRSVGRART